MCEGGTTRKSWLLSVYPEKWQNVHEIISNSEMSNLSVPPLARSKTKPHYQRESKQRGKISVSILQLTASLPWMNLAVHISLPWRKALEPLLTKIKESPASPLAQSSAQLLIDTLCLRWLNTRILARFAEKAMCVQGVNRLSRWQLAETRNAKWRGALNPLSQITDLPAWKLPPLWLCRRTQSWFALLGVLAQSLPQPLDWSDNGVLLLGWQKRLTHLKSCFVWKLSWKKHLVCWISQCLS